MVLIWILILTLCFQVMYMYYLLGYRLLGANDESMYSNQSDVGKTGRQSSTTGGHSGNITQRSRIFRSMNHYQRAQVLCP